MGCSEDGDVGPTPPPLCRHYITCQLLSDSPLTAAGLVARVAVNKFGAHLNDENSLTCSVVSY